MKRKFLYGSLLALACSGCQKKVDVIVTEDLGPSTTWYASIPDNAASRVLKQELKLNIPKDSLVIFTSGTTGYSTGPSLNLFFAIPQGALTAGGGQTFSGKAYLSSTLLKTKGEMIRMGLPTRTNGLLLESGGAMYAMFTDSLGNELAVMPNRSIMMNYTDSPVSQIRKIFHGQSTGVFDFTWAAPADSTLNYVSAAQNFYMVYTNKLGWINNASYHNSIVTTPPQTQVAVDLPSYYTNANSIVYISFDDMKSVVELSGDAISRQFRINNLPIGKQVTVLVMSKQANDYFLGSAQITTSAVAQQDYQTITVNPTISTLQNIGTFLDTL